MKVMSTSCICPVLMCLCFVQRCYGASHQSSIKVTRNQTKHAAVETEVHHRPKRGWVWNQFFVLEEHLGPDPQYVGKLHSNSDKGDGSVKYILTGEGAGRIFIIDDTTGDIHATTSLDREQKSQYVLHAQAIDRWTNEALEPESEFIIKVQDINDNAPEFSDGPFVVTVPEMSDVGTSVLQVTATDADDPTYGNSARVVYSILQGQPYFSVDPKTGVIRTALPNMDREAREHYSVVIQAKDMAGQVGGLSGSTTVNITLTDVNDNPPRFPQRHYQLYVPESAQVGTAVGKIKAIDADTGLNADIKYLIVNGDGAEIFDIATDGDNREGIISLKKPLNYEKKKHYTLNIEGRNPHVDDRFSHLELFKDYTTLKVIVGDVDESPLFTLPSYIMDVYENSKIGTLVGLVTAHDPDSANSLVRYVIEYSEVEDQYFNIDANTGAIRTEKVLDREEMPWYSITVTAAEAENPSLLSNATVDIRVLDVNDNAPELAQEYDVVVCENAKEGKIIETIRAVDQDDSANGPRFHFSLGDDLLINPNFTIQNNEVIVVLFVTLRRSRKEPLKVSEEDIRENIVTYDDEGGGEQDTEAFDITALRNPSAAEDFKYRRDVRPEVFQTSRHQILPSFDSINIQDCIKLRLAEANLDTSGPPYDSLQTYAFEGHRSEAGTVSPIDSLTTNSDKDFNDLDDWAPAFQKLAELYGEIESERTT
ncbi:cadherin-18 isoform X3 [Ambystoma mexicanum]|uniref:cadherin-18 isoform X3 n=1 Tax=Ambystoma mexicanum TaxID=8296 RepID=UPI0037E7852F